MPTNRSAFLRSEFADYFLEATGAAAAGADAGFAAEAEAAGAAGAEAAGAAAEAAGAEAAGAEAEAEAEAFGFSPTLHAVRARASRPTITNDFFICFPSEN